MKSIKLRLMREKPLSFLDMLADAGWGDLDWHERHAITEGLRAADAEVLRAACIEAGNLLGQIGQWFMEHGDGPITENDAIYFTKLVNQTCESIIEAIQPTTECVAVEDCERLVAQVAGFVNTATALARELAAEGSASARLAELLLGDMQEALRGTPPAVDCLCPDYPFELSRDCPVHVELGASVSPEQEGLRKALELIADPGALLKYPDPVPLPFEIAREALGAATPAPCGREFGAGALCSLPLGHEGGHVSAPARPVPGQSQNITDAPLRVCPDCGGSGIKWGSHPAHGSIRVACGCGARPVPGPEPEETT